MNFFEIAHIRDGKFVYTGEAMLLAILAHTTGKDRESLDGKIVRRLMKDINNEQAGTYRFQPVV